MPCSCTVHFEQQLLDHIKCRRNAEAKLMLNESLAKISDCRGTLLHHAVLTNNADITRYLIDMGIPIDSSGPAAKTPLMVAAERGDAIIVRALLEAGANVEMVDADGKSALYNSLHVTNIDFEVVEALLLRERAQAPTTEQLIEKSLAAGCTFPYFVLLRDVDILENLLQRGFDVDERTCEKRTALHYAALIKDLKSAELLVARGADVNAFDHCSAGPLYYAAEGSDPDMLRFLLEHGANPDPDVRFVEHMPLFACFILGDSGDDEKVCECAELLLERGAFTAIPRTFVKQVELCYDPILRSPRLNCLLAHQAALDAFGVRSCEEEEHLTTFVELKEYYDNCRKILEVVVAGKMRLVELLFVDSNHEIKLRARDKSFVRQVEQFCANPALAESFPYYAKILKKQINKATLAVEMEKKAILVVCALFKCDDNQLSIFARQVVIGYLSERDIEELCRV